MKQLTHTIQAQTCPEAWVKAIEYLVEQNKQEAYYLTLAIEFPDKMTPQDFYIYDVVCRCGKMACNGKATVQVGKKGWRQGR